MKSRACITRLGFSMVACCLITAAAFILNGCGGGNGQPSSQSSNTVIVQSNVKVLPSDGSVMITNITPTSVTLTGSVPTLSPGTIFVSGQGNGLMRKVVSVSQSGNNTVVQTTDGTLFEIFKQGKISLHKTFGPSDFGTPTNVAPGVTITLITGGKSARSRDSASLSQSILIIFDDLQIPIPNGPVQLQNSASIGLNMDLDIDTANHSIKFSANLLGGSNANVRTLGTSYVSPFRQLLCHLPLKPINIQTGPIPVIVVPTMDIYCTADGQVQAGLNMSATGNTTVGGGVNYATSSGWSSSPSWDLQTFSVTPTLPALANATFTVTPLYSEISLLIWNTSLAYIHVDCPKYTFKLQSQTSSLSFSPLEVDEDFDGILGSTSKTLGLQDYSAVFNFPSVLYPPTRTWTMTHTYSNGQQATDLMVIFSEDSNGNFFGVQQQTDGKVIGFLTGVQTGHHVSMDVNYPTSNSQNQFNGSAIIKRTGSLSGKTLAGQNALEGSKLTGQDALEAGAAPYPTGTFTAVIK